MIIPELSQNYPMVISENYPLILSFLYPTSELTQVKPGLLYIYISLDWFKGKSTGNHGFYHQIDRAFL